MIEDNESKKVTKELDYKLLYWIISIFTLLLGAILYRQNILQKHAKDMAIAKEKLIETQNNFILGQKIANIGIWNLNYSNQKLEWSEGVHYIFGTNPDNFGASFEAFMEFVHPDDREKLNEAYSSSVREKTDYFVKHRIITTKGETKYVEESCQNFFDESGNIYKSIGTVLDITQRRGAEKALESLNHQLEDKIIEEVEKNREQEQQLFAQSRMAQMGEMISMIAHQWRQPLGAIASTAVNLKLKLELETFDLDSKEGITEAREYFLERLNKINNYVQNLTTTIDDFRNFYKPNKLTEPLHVEKTVKQSLTIIGASLENCYISIVQEHSHQEVVEVHLNEMVQVILNILKNAQDNFKDNNIENPTITIKTQKKQISICDNGGGIPKDIIDNIFDPYFSTKLEKNGTGLGLYMSKIIVEEHHKGKLEVANTDNGVCFTIKL